MSQKHHAWGLFSFLNTDERVVLWTSCSSSVGIGPGAENQLFLFASASNKKSLLSEVVQVGCCYIFLLLWQTAPYLGSQLSKRMGCSFRYFNSRVLSYGHCELPRGSWNRSIASKARAANGKCSPYRVADAKVLSTRRAYKQDSKSVDGKAFLDL